MNRTLGIALFAALASVVAWMSTAAVADDATVAAAPVANGPVVKLIDAGEEPRHVMRLTPNVGDVQFVRYDQKMTMVQTINGAKSPKVVMPTISMTLRIAVTKTDDTKIHSEFACTEVRIGDDSELPAGVVEMMADMLEPMTEWHGSMTADHRGFVHEFESITPENASDLLRQTMDGLKESANQMVSPLPEEAIGVGAKWSTTLAMALNGMELNQTYTTTVTEIDDSSFAYECTVKQSAPEQDFMSQGINFHVNMLEGEGTGSGRIFMRTMMPKRAVANVTQNSNLVATDQGTTIEQTIELKIDIEHINGNDEAKSSDDAKD